MSHWIDFVRSHKNQDFTGTHKFVVLSHLYKNKMANLVTVHIDYLSNLHYKNDSLQRMCLELEQEVSFLRNVNSLHQN